MGQIRLGSQVWGGRECICRLSSREMETLVPWEAPQWSSFGVRTGHLPVSLACTVCVKPDESPTGRT